jgi:protein dopey
LLVELVKIPGGYKAWRRDVYDVFNENVFFTISAAQGSKWKQIFKIFLANDKERITEFITRISAATSSILRSSRDQDRLFHVRRLAFIILSGDVDQFVGQTGQIKEKLMELGRTASIDPIHGEVFLLFRTLMLRLSPVHLTSFWPLLVSEIQTLFCQILEQSGIVSKEQLPLFFEACKVLDMMLVLESEDFQLYTGHLLCLQIDKSGCSSQTRLKPYIDRQIVIRPPSWTGSPSAWDLA